MILNFYVLNEACPSLIDPLYEGSDGQGVAFKRRFKRTRCKKRRQLKARQSHEGIPDLSLKSRRAFRHSRRCVLALTVQT